MELSLVQTFLATVVKRQRLFGTDEYSTLEELLEKLMSSSGEISAMVTAREILDRYKNLSDEEKLKFFNLLESNFRFIKKVLPIPPEIDPINASDLEKLLTTAFHELLSRPNSRDFLNMMINEAAGADIVFAGKINSFYDDLAEIFTDYIAKVQEKDLIGKGNPAQYNGKNQQTEQQQPLFIF